MSDSLTYFIVKGTFALLLLASILTWGLVLVKARQRWVIRSQDARFTRTAGWPLRLAALRTVAKTEKLRGPSWRVARAGVATLDELGDEATSEDIERALQDQIQRERQAAESGLAVLASIGSTAPFVGLFGTVWGIIHALRAIGQTGSASLEVVAGPIGEALIATGVGIAVAVPAVLAYNFFVRRLKIQTAGLEQLGSAFLGAVARGDRASDRELRIEHAEPRSSAARALETRREASV